MTKQNTALASGSGDHANHSGDATNMVDHAELARLAKTNKAYGFLVSVKPETVLALLAENAALRAEVSQANANGASHWSRATEAERKLAEAVGHLTAMTHVAPRAHEVTEALAFISSLEDHR